VRAADATVRRDELDVHGVAGARCRDKGTAATRGGGVRALGLVVGRPLEGAGTKAPRALDATCIVEPEDLLVLKTAAAAGNTRPAGQWRGIGGHSGGDGGPAVGRRAGNSLDCAAVAVEPPHGTGRITGWSGHGG